MSKQDIVHKRWINIHIGISSPAFYIIKNKKHMKDYAEELGWIVKVDKEGIVNDAGIKVYNMCILPNKKGLISPEEFRQVHDKVISFVYELVLNSDPEAEKLYRSRTILNFETAKKPEDLEFFETLGNGKGDSEFLFIKYRITDRLALERKDLNMSHLFFDEKTVEDTFKELFKLGTSWFDKLFEKKETIATRELIKKQISDWFGIEL